MDQTHSYAERREFARVPKQVPIEVTRLAFPMPGRADAHGHGKDIGGGGVCFTAGLAFQPRTMLSVKISIKGWSAHKKPHSRLVDIAGEEPFVAIAEVAWCRPAAESGLYDVGVRFVDVYADDFKALLKYLEQ